MLVVLIALVLTHCATLTHAGGTAIPITLYTDNNCDTPSTTAANISLEIGVCAVTPGLGSFDLQPYPCSSGVVAQYVFSDTACGQISYDDYQGGTDGHCYYPIEGDMAAIMLSCDQTNPGQPTSTTTINVGAIATNGASTSSSSSSPSSSSPAAGSGDGNGSSSKSGSAVSGWNSLDLGVRIGIIVSLAVGIPPILLTLYMIMQKRKRLQRKAREDAWAHGTSLPTYPYSHEGPHGGSQGGSHGAFHSGVGQFNPRPMMQPTPHAQKWASHSCTTGGTG